MREGSRREGLMDLVRVWLFLKVTWEPLQGFG